MRGDFFFNIFMDAHMHIELSDTDKERFEEIKLKLKELDGGEKSACMLPVDMQEFLKTKSQAWREQKQTGHRVSTRAVVQDARHTLESISSEVSLGCSCNLRGSATNSLL